MADSKKFGAPFHRLELVKNLASVRDERYRACCLLYASRPTSALVAPPLSLRLGEPPVMLRDDDDEEAEEEDIASLLTGWGDASMVSPQATQSEGHTTLWLNRTS